MFKKNFLFLFSSNIVDSDDKNFLISLKEKARTKYYNKWDDTVDCVFLCEAENKENNGIALAKAKLISEAYLFLVPAWLELNDDVKEEIRLARNQGLKIKLFSHWDKENLKEVFDFFDVWGADFLWNEKIFKLNN